MLLFGVLILVGCGDGKRYAEGGSGGDGLESDGDGTGVSDDGGAPDDDGGSGSGGDDDDADEADRDAVVLGRVWVELYTVDEDGDHVPLSWEAAMGTEPHFPFGSIFVAAFDEDEDDKTYFDQDTIVRPSTEGDTYVLSVDPTETDHANEYATLDIRGDGILGSGEPIGVYGDDIQIRRGTEADDVDIAIMVN